MASKALVPTNEASMFKITIKKHMFKITIKEQFETDEPLLKAKFTALRLTKSDFFLWDAHLGNSNLVAPYNTMQHHATYLITRTLYSILQSDMA